MEHKVVQKISSRFRKCLLKKLNIKAMFINTRIEVNLRNISVKKITKSQS